MSSIAYHDIEEASTLGPLAIPNEERSPYPRYRVVQDPEKGSAPIELELAYGYPALEISMENFNNWWGIQGNFHKAADKPGKWFPVEPRMAGKAEWLLEVWFNTGHYWDPFRDGNTDTIPLVDFHMKAMPSFDRYALVLAVNYLVSQGIFRVEGGEIQLLKAVPERAFGEPSKAPLKISKEAAEALRKFNSDEAKAARAKAVESSPKKQAPPAAAKPATAAPDVAKKVRQTYRKMANSSREDVRKAIVRLLPEADEPTIEHYLANWAAYRARGE